jgi:double-stranded uracil-DNA glycosylase
MAWAASTTPRRMAFASVRDVVRDSSLRIRPQPVVHTSHPGPSCRARPKRRGRGPRAGGAGGVPDVVGPSLDVLFVGINPDPISGERRHHFANPRNRFWRLLHEAGFTARRLDPSAEARLIEVGLGVTNLVPRVSRSSSELSPADFSRGRLVLERKVARWRPRAVVLVGMTVWRALTGKRARAVGLEQPSRGGTRIFVVPNPSGRNAAYSYSEMLRQWRDLARELGPPSLSSGGRGKQARSLQVG